MTVAFTLDGVEFTALNGGSIFKFSEAISLTVACETQKEVDYYWNRPWARGEPGPWGWLMDRFGLSRRRTRCTMGCQNKSGNDKTEFTVLDRRSRCAGE